MHDYHLDVARAVHYERANSLFCIDLGLQYIADIDFHDYLHVRSFWNG